jgi:hypothetical protein
MANFSKFDRIEAIVTKPVGDFTCDGKTNLSRFMWVMTRDVSMFMIFYYVILQLNGVRSVSSADVSLVQEQVILSTFIQYSVNMTC